MKYFPHFGWLILVFLSFIFPWITSPIRRKRNNITVNEYRPRQAREALALSLEVQRKDREAAIARFNNTFSNVADSLEKALARLPQSDGLPKELQAKIQVPTLFLPLVSADERESEIWEENRADCF